MLNEEAKERITNRFFKFLESSPTDEDFSRLEEVVETLPSISELDRDIVKLRIFDGLTFGQIQNRLDIEKIYTVQNHFGSASGKVFRAFKSSALPDDGTERLSELMKNRNGLTSLRRAGIYTIGQLTDLLKMHGSLKDVQLTVDRAASIVYYLDKDGYPLRELVTDEEMLESFEDLDRRNYLHIDQFESMLKSCSRVQSVERVTNSYTASSKTEFGSFDVELNDTQTLRLKVSINSIEDTYKLNAEIDESESYEGFEYQKIVSREVSTDSENLVSAMNFLLFVSRKAVN